MTAHFNSTDGQATATATIRIVIVDDHPAVRDGLSARIQRQPDMELCGEACDVDEATALIAATQPDVAVVDISLRKGNGLDVIHNVRAAGNPVRILVWSMFDAALYADRSFRAGADGYITKEEATDKIIQAIRQVHAGEPYRPQGMHEVGVHRSRTAESADPQTKGLSYRELQVFRFMGEGLDMNEISQRMGLSAKTIETYRARIRKKLHQSSRMGLVRLAVEWVVRQRGGPATGA